MSRRPTMAGVCSGIGGFDLAFHRAGAEILWACENEAQCRAVLQAHFPGVLCYEDMLADAILAAPRPDVFVGGTPCQGFSVAGLRKGLNDDRSNLALRFIRLCDHFDPELVLWENVPGVLSDKENAFGCFLAGLVGADAPLVPTKESGGRWTNAGLVTGPRRTAAWRVLDSQYFGVAQRRERVFVVASARAERPFQILFEPESVRRHTPPSREKGKGIAADIVSCLKSGGCGIQRTGESRGQDPVVAIQAFGGNNQGGAIDIATACNAHGGTGRHDFESETFCVIDNPGRGGRTHSRQIAHGYAVRRLTPTECERLQAFPDGWTAVQNSRGKPMADGPRYKQLGNAVTVSVAEWLAKRLLKTL